MPSSRGSCQSMDRICISCFAGEFFTTSSTGGVLENVMYLDCLIICLPCQTIILSLLLHHPPSKLDLDYTIMVWTFSSTCLGTRIVYSFSGLYTKDCTQSFSFFCFSLDPTEWPKGSQSSGEVWREDQGLLSRSGRKRRPPSLLDGSILWFFSNCGATVRFLTRYDGVLREPLVWY